MKVLRSQIMGLCPVRASLMTRQYVLKAFEQPPIRNIEAIQPEGSQVSSMRRRSHHDSLVLHNANPACLLVVAWAEPDVVRGGKSNFNREMKSLPRINKHLMEILVQLAEACFGILKGYSPFCGVLKVLLNMMINTTIKDQEVKHTLQSTLKTRWLSSTLLVPETASQEASKAAQWLNARNHMPINNKACTT